MIKTFDLHVQYIDGTVKHYTNLSRVAVKRYIEYWQEQEDFLCYDMGEHDPIWENMIR